MRKVNTNIVKPILIKSSVFILGLQYHRISAASKLLKPTKDTGRSWQIQTLP